MAQLTLMLPYSPVAVQTEGMVKKTGRRIMYERHLDKVYVGSILCSQITLALGIDKRRVSICDLSLILFPSGLKG